MLNIANFITVSRIALTPAIVFCMMRNCWVQALIIFFAAVLTDVLDGWVARTFHQHSKIGQILDPIADKILFGSMMFSLLWLLPSHGLLFFTLCFLMLKEIILLLGGAILWFGYQKFILPSKLSRQASWYEFLLLLVIMIDRSDIFFIPSFVLMIVAIFNIVISTKLLMLYARKIFNHADIS